MSCSTTSCSRTSWESSDDTDATAGWAAAARRWDERDRLGHERRAAMATISYPPSPAVSRLIWCPAGVLHHGADGGTMMASKIIHTQREECRTARARQTKIRLPVPSHSTTDTRSAETPNEAVSSGSLNLTEPENTDQTGSSGRLDSAHSTKK